MLPPPPTGSSRCSLPISLITGGSHAYMCQVCIRSLHGAPSTLCITGDTLCVCICPCLHPPPPTACSRCSLPVSLSSGCATLTCVKPASEPCTRLHPSCVSRVTLCVCVCVFDIPCSPHPHCVLPLFIAH